MNASITHQLKHPLKRVFRGPDGDREETVDAVELRTSVRVRDLRVLDNATGEIAKGAALVAQLGGLTARDADDLSAEDFMALTDLVAGFMPPGLKTGETA